MSSVEGLFDRLRQPEYTGENRCIPCTAVNLAIAIVLAEGIVLLVWPAGGATALALGLLVFALSIAAIYLRGYLVPGTPWITKRYFPDRVLRLFDKSPQDHDGPVAGDPIEGGIDVEAALLSAGALEDCADRDDLCITEEFRDRWTRERDRVRDSSALRREETAQLHEIDVDDVEIQEREDAWYVYEGDHVIGYWPSRAAAIADLGGSRALRARLESWTDIGPAARGELLYGLRLFVEACPDCGGRVEMGEEVVESCCRSVSVVDVSCRECDTRLLEMEHPGA